MTHQHQHASRTSSSPTPPPLETPTASACSRRYGTAAVRDRDSCWKQSVVKRTLAFVEDDIQHVLAQSPFLLQSEPGSHIALFHRSEIRTGARLGKGGFSHVDEIVAFDLNPQYSQLLTESQQQLRHYYREQIRTGRGRYAIKYLQERLLDEPKSFQFAASDLAIEAAYLSAIQHPNILSVRGLPIHGLESFAEGRHDSYFLILDRLESTLDQRIAQWKRKHDMPLLGKAGQALQLACALDYLHQRGILFRDLKPQNIGFTSDGLLKLLDFGLCRELPAQTSPDEMFEMSGVGTRRYMAVEIVNSGYYNDKADVYSWAMVFWEMLSLERPYSTYSVEDHTSRVCQGGERPILHRKWPLPIQNLLQHSWTTSIPDRLSMKEVECLLRTYIECCRVLDDDSAAICDSEYSFDSKTEQIPQHNGFPVHSYDGAQRSGVTEEDADYTDELIYYGGGQQQGGDLEYTDQVDDREDYYHDHDPQHHHYGGLEQAQDSLRLIFKDDDDHRMRGCSVTTQDMSSHASLTEDGMHSMQGSVLESVAGTTTTATNTTDGSSMHSSFDLESIAFPATPPPTKRVLPPPKAAAPSYKATSKRKQPPSGSKQFCRLPSL